MKNSSNGKKTAEARRPGRIGKALGTLLLSAAVLAVGLGLPAKVSAGAPPGVYTIRQTEGAVMARQGDEEVLVTMTVQSSQKVDGLYGEITTAGSDIKVAQSKSAPVNLEAGGKATVYFTVDIDPQADTGYKSMTVVLKDSTGKQLDKSSASVNISARIADPGNSGNYVNSVDVSYTLSNPDGIVAGGLTELKVVLFNRGNTTLKDVQATLGLPEGISIQNAPATQYIGYMMTGDRQTIKFPLTAKAELENKNYTVDVNIEAKDPANAAANFKRTLYIPVTGGSGDSFGKVEITSVNLPAQVSAGEDFVLSFNVKNNGAGDLKNVKITAEAPEGIINKSKNIFIETLPKGGSSSFSVTFSSGEGAEQKSYPIKISVEPASGGGGGEGGAAGTPPVSQYASVLIRGTGNTKTPQLMVENYTYGGSFVQAGGTFRLNLTLHNTSKKQLSNIKVKIDAADGTFVPVGSSNSFFIESIKAKGRYTKSLMLSVKPLAEQKTTPVTVGMSYEDGSGNAFTAEDVVSIPVMQEIRLKIDSVVAPPEIYVGMPASAEIKFYNMGKSQISNVRADTEGDFDLVQSNSYFAGNMDPGRSDSYSFTFVPREEGSFSGKVIFSFEDASGNPQILESPFTFTAMEMPMPDEPDLEGPKKKKIPVAAIAGLAAAVLIAAGLIIFLKIRKARINRKLQLEDEEFENEL